MSEKTCECGKEGDCCKLTGSAEDPFALITALRRGQETHGYLPEKVLREISEELNKPFSQIYGIVTFFNEFSLEPRGRNRVYVCRGSACGVKGGKDVLNAVKNIVGVNEGETTPDYEYTLETVSCFGNCAVAPAMLVNKDLYGDLTPERVARILDIEPDSNEDSND